MNTIAVIVSMGPKGPGYRTVPAAELDLRTEVARGALTVFAVQAAGRHQAVATVLAKLCGALGPTPVVAQLHPPANPQKTEKLAV